MNMAVMGPALPEDEGQATVTLQYVSLNARKLWEV